MVRCAHTTDQAVLSVGEDKPTSKSNIHKHNIKIKAVTSVYDSLSPLFSSRMKFQEINSELVIKILHKKKNT